VDAAVDPADPPGNAPPDGAFPANGPGIAGADIPPVASR